MNVPKTFVSHRRRARGLVRAVLSALLLLGLTTLRTSAQDQDTARIDVVVIDTIVVEANSFVLLPDSAFFTDQDTVIYVIDTIRTRLEAIIKHTDQKSDTAFYNDLKRRMSRGKISRQLFDALFNLNRGSRKRRSSRPPPPDRSALYEGYIVGAIHLKQLDVFGPSIADTARRADNRLSRFYNSIHTHTLDRVLRNNLPLEPGDTLTSLRRADSERIIRSLPFIRDARLLVQPRPGDSDTVDLLLITEDVIPYSVAARPEGWLEGDLSVGNNNILGTGHELNHTLVIKPDEPQVWGYEGQYRLPNIRGSFIEADLRYINTNFDDGYFGSIQRTFFLPEVRRAGGAEISYQHRTTFAPSIDSYAAIDTFTDGRAIPRIRYRFFQQDYWLARSVGLPGFDNRTRLSAGLRFYQQHFDDRPAVSATENPGFHHRRQFLASLAFSKRYYTTEQLVFTYGRTEDIPLGQLAELVVGPEFGEYYRRWFTGLSYARGNYLHPLGYVSVRAQGGGFWRNGQMEDGLLQVGWQSYSYLFYARRTRYRFFFDANYTKGIRRLPTIDFRERYIDIGRNRGIRGLSNNALAGNERLAFRVEGVAYLPVDFYSFQVATFGFVDTGFIAAADETVFDRSPYLGIGAGLRVRNENLAFRTFQVRVIVYPNAPAGESWFGISVGSIPLPRFRDFMPNKPQVFRFE